jgi:hypothetical protein
MCREIQLSLKSLNKNTLPTDLLKLMIKTHCILLRMINVSDKFCREYPNTCFAFNTSFFQKSCCFLDNVQKQH